MVTMSHITSPALVYLICMGLWGLSDKGGHSPQKKGNDLLSNICSLIQPHFAEGREEASKIQFLLHQPFLKNQRKERSVLLRSLAEGQSGLSRIKKDFTEMLGLVLRELLHQVSRIRQGLQPRRATWLTHGASTTHPSLVPGRATKEQHRR